MKNKTTAKPVSKPAAEKKNTASHRKAKPAKKETTPAIKIEAGLHMLAIPRGAHKRKRILGRGSSSGHGKTSTRGSKGQTSRAGRHFYLGFEGGQSPLIRRMPKRGFHSLFRKEYQIVNLVDLNKIKEAVINPAVLQEVGLIKDKDKLVKILGNGEIKNAITVQAHAFSRKASQSIANAGGKTELINV